MEHVSGNVPNVSGLCGARNIWVSEANHQRAVRYVSIEDSLQVVDLVDSNWANFQNFVPVIPTDNFTRTGNLN